MQHLYKSLSLPKFTHLPAASTTKNLGDDIQVECANRLWNVGKFVNRDNFDEWPENAIIPFMGWYGYDSFKTPPKSQCILISLHFSNEARLKISHNRNFFNWFRDTAKKQNFPVYARDLDTRDWIRNLGITCEFGGCITSTLPAYTGPRSGILYIDAPTTIAQSNKMSSNIVDALPNFSIEKRLECAQHVLDKISKAEFVHTSRLHIALPCRALNTPFKFYDHDKIFEKHRLSGHDLI